MCVYTHIGIHIYIYIYIYRDIYIILQYLYIHTCTYIHVFKHKWVHPSTAMSSWFVFSHRGDATSQSSRKQLGGHCTKLVWISRLGR